MSQSSEAIHIWTIGTLQGIGLGPCRGGGGGGGGRLSSRSRISILLLLLLFFFFYLD